MRAIATESFKVAPKVQDLPKPRAEGDQVLVRLSHAGVNPFDWKVAEGALDGKVPHTFPLVLGFDGAGTVEAIGPAVDRFRVGDRVFGQCWQVPIGRGTYAEYVAVSQSAPIAKIPGALGDAEAAALPTAGMTAIDLLDKASLAASQTLLVVGATGGVGSFLTQLARRRGLRVVATGAPADAARLKSLGADAVVDFTRPSVEDEIRAAAPDGLDGLLDLASDGAGFTKYTALVKSGGVAFTTNYVADAAALEKRGVRGGNFMLGASANLAERLAAEVVDGKLQITIERRVPFTEALATLAILRAGHARGKTVIAI